jgi:hypothetical protein
MFVADSEAGVSKGVLVFLEVLAAFASDARRKQVRPPATGDDREAGIYAVALGSPRLSDRRTESRFVGEVPLDWGLVSDVDVTAGQGCCASFANEGKLTVAPAGVKVIAIPREDASADVAVAWDFDGINGFGAQPSTTPGTTPMAFLFDAGEDASPTTDWFLEAGEDA